MKTIKMNLNSEPFEKIKNGSKIYELRLYDEKWRAIDMGDEIIFECRGGDMCDRGDGNGYCTDVSRFVQYCANAILRGC